MNQSRNDQSGKTCKSCCAKEKHHSGAGDLTGRTDISDAADTHNNRTEYKWKDHHVQGIHVNASKKTGYGQNRSKAVGQKQSGQNTEKQADKDRTGDMLLIPCVKFFHFIPPHK